MKDLQARDTKNNFDYLLCGKSIGHPLTHVILCLLSHVFWVVGSGSGLISCVNILLVFGFVLICSLDGMLFSIRLGSYFQILNQPSHSFDDHIGKAISLLCAC